jgi:predicted PurR-regulated permease PerM
MEVEVLDERRIIAVFVGGFLLLVLLLTAVLIKPILLALSLTIVQVYIFHPAIQFLLPKVKRRSVAIVVLSFLFLVPFFFFSVVLLTTFYNELIELSKVPKVNELIDIAGVTLKDFVSPQMQSISFSTVTSGFEAIFGFLKMIGGILMQIFLASLLTAYVLYKEDSITRFIHSIKRRRVRNFIHLVDEGVRQVVYSMFLTALVTGFIATVIYVIFGIPFSTLLGVLTAIISLIPILGAWLVYLPISLYLISLGSIVSGLLLLGLSIVFVSTLPDIVVRPFIISRHEHVDFGLLILAFFTGTMAFGPVGVILGPLILIILVAFIRIYIEKEIEKTLE